jgi:hypothetical protein
MTALRDYVGGLYKLHPAGNGSLVSPQLLANQTVPLYTASNASASATGAVATLSTFAIASAGINFRIVLAKTRDRPNGFVANSTALLVGGYVITFTVSSLSKTLVYFC